MSQSQVAVNLATMRKLLRLNRTNLEVYQGELDTIPTQDTAIRDMNKVLDVPPPPYNQVPAWPQQPHFDNGYPFQPPPPGGQGTW
ncbi:hypothetical protein QFC24_003913 [Naganishia onofrii]|uniref:Uncharacterized protein n=1 Tax=Naganishia onofrii TaxID=1851511 RepID=A0ACC2XFQ6_9TREE|nr:hypothetical protein QFC24_003913 [Naganishia onofrii]